MIFERHCNAKNSLACLLIFTGRTIENRFTSSHSQTMKRQHRWSRMIKDWTVTFILVTIYWYAIKNYSIVYEYAFPYYKIQQMEPKEAYHLKGTQLNCNFAVNKLPSNVCTLFYIPRWVSTRKMYIVSGSPGTRIVIEIPLRYKRSLSPEKNQTNH